MSGIPEATPIRLTEEERTMLEALARSTKAEYRLRQRARIVLLAATKIPSNRDQLGFDPADVETVLKTALHAANVEISEWMVGAPEPDC